MKRVPWKNQIEAVCMTAISYSDPISAVLKNEQLFVEKRPCAKFQIDISKSEELVSVQTNSQTGVNLSIYILYRVSEVCVWMLQTSWQTKNTFIQSIKIRTFRFLLPSTLNQAIWKQTISWAKDSLKHLEVGLLF